MCGYFLGNFWAKLGHFLFHHLVTLSRVIIVHVFSLAFLMAHASFLPAHAMSCAKKIGAITFARMGGSPGLVVTRGDSCSIGCEFESRHHILFFTNLFVVKFVLCVWKDGNKWKNSWSNGLFHRNQSIHLEGECSSAGTRKNQTGLTSAVGRPP